MPAYLNPPRFVFRVGFLNLILGVLLLLVSQMSLADVVITGDTPINGPTTYANTVLNMSNGRFTVNATGSLTIDNCTVNVTVSPTNPFMLQVLGGTLLLRNSRVNVVTSGIPANPNNLASNQLMKVNQGTITITGNTFSIDHAFTVQLAEIKNITVNKTLINNNNFDSFHGGIYLLQNSNTEISDNNFVNVSLSNVFTTGSQNQIKRNIFTFPGRLINGDAIAVVNSTSINIIENIIVSSANYGVYINGGQSIFISNNKISDSLSYGVYIQTPTLHTKRTDIDQTIAKNKIPLLDNSNVVLSGNYIAQNRYGLAGGRVDRLLVTNNVFMQRFVDNSVRQYWTDNVKLLPIATNLTWLNNQYKEAFTQEVPGDNRSALQFLPFPATGGVFIP